MAWKWPLPATAADGYPSRPIRIVVPFSPGGAADVIGRAVAGGLAAELKQPVVVDNVAGASGVIGSKAVARAKPDGYTLLVTGATTHAIGPAMSAQPPYDPQRDFAPVSLVASITMGVVVHPDVPAKTLAELVALAQDRPGALNFPSAGAGSLGHMAGLQFQSLSGTRMTHVPYKGAQPALTDLLAGHVQVYFAEIGSILPWVKTGKLRLLAVMAPQRLSAVPNVPTVTEAGMAELDVPGWAGIFAPAGTPPTVIDTLSRATRAALDSPQVREELAVVGMQPLASDSQALRSRLELDVTRMRELVRQYRLVAE